MLSMESPVFLMNHNLFNQRLGAEIRYLVVKYPRIRKTSINPKAKRKLCIKKSAGKAKIIGSVVALKSQASLLKKTLWKSTNNVSKLTRRAKRIARGIRVPRRK